MLDRDHVISGLKVRLLADLGFFLEGTQGVIQRVTDDSSSIWHAMVAWRCPVRKRKIQGLLKPQDLDFVEAVPQKRRTLHRGSYGFLSRIDCSPSNIMVTSSTVNADVNPRIHSSPSSGNDQ
jgi:hypothetical protein